MYIYINVIIYLHINVHIVYNIYFVYCISHMLIGPIVSICILAHRNDAKVATAAVDGSLKLNLSV